VKIQHLEQYSGPWAMEETAFNAAIDHVNRLDLGSHLAAMAIKADAGDTMDVMPAMAMVDGVCVIDCVGTMTKYGSSLSSGPSTVALRGCVRKMAMDPNCKAILMRFDSPGGSAAGTDELATELSAAAAKKPVGAFVDGMAASAAYWAASQCSPIVAAPSAIVGSIGTYGVMYDQSAKFAQDGVKAVVVRAGEHKGVGATGTEITPQQIADQTRLVNEVNDLFVAGVAKGRKISMDDARKLNDGRAHVGANAKAQGLVDQIGSFEDAMATMKAAAEKTSGAKGNNAQKQPAPARMAGAHSKEIAMSDEIAPGAEKPQAATMKDLKAKFPKSTADWREQCHGDSLTLVQAGERWMEHLSSENVRLADEVAQAKAAGKQIGTPPLNMKNDKEAGKSAEASADPRTQIMAIAAEFQKGGLSREKSFAKACKENPEIHQAWLAAHTEQHGETVRRGHRTG
jgi:signal peptide peptidase SppA